METDILTIFFAFVFFSVLGWFLEVAYRSLNAKRFVNPGLLKGPYLILYGAGSLILIGSIHLLADSSIMVKALFYFVTITGFELISALLSYKLFGIRLWNYSDLRFQYKGHVSLRFSLYWVLLAFAFEYLIFPLSQKQLIGISPYAIGSVSGIILSIIVLDFVVVCLRRLIRVEPGEKDALEIKYMNTAQPLLENPMVNKLSMYNHHREKDRLEHVKEVAWISFLCSERFGFDSQAVIRGALLHDLFYYDWLREGPRLHGFRHHNIALKNARKIISLSPKEEDIIKKHMWPLTVIPPRYMESLTVSLVDTFCSARDYFETGTSKNEGDSNSLFNNQN